ncbi:MAG: hypothetical protein ACP5H2_01905 [Solirubrobacteraceae bacterium]
MSFARPQLSIELDGLARQPLFVGGAWRDHLLFAKVAPGDRR